jgi:hypothetical protein
VLGGVHSFGGNRTVSGIILLSIFVFLESTQPQRRFRYLPLVSSLITASGTVYALYFIYLLIKYRAKFYKSIFVLMILIFIIFFNEQDEFLINKFNSDYLVFLGGYKYDQILEYLARSDIFDRIFGMGSGAFVSMSKEIKDYGSAYGDFIFLDFFARFGVVGFLILIFLVIFFARGNVILPISLLIAGTLHYHIIFSSPGQVIGAYFFVYAMREARLTIKGSKLHRYSANRGGL